MTNIRNAMMAAAGGAGLDGYVVENSLLLNDDDSAHLTTTMGTFDSNDIGTVSFWFKRGNNGISHMHLFTHGTAILRLRAKIGSTDAIWIETATGTQKKTTQVFRDNQAWYHIVVACDSTQASNSDRIKLYINGTQVTDFETDTAHTQNQDFFFNAEAWWVGSYLDTTLNSDGYMSQFCFIDGQQLTPSSFGEFDDQGYWRPIDLSGLTFGTNGFLQDYSDSSHFGKNAAVADPTAYVPVSVNFDGSADYLTVTSATLGAGDAKTGCGSVWFKNGGSDGTNRHIVSGTSSHFAVYLNTSNQLRVTGEDASHVSAFTMISTQTFTSSNADKWYHVAWSYDAASASNQMYINGVAENLSTDTNSDRDIDYTIDYVVGARHTYFDENWTGDIADLYLNFATNIDLSNASNLAEFISADGLPVDLGSDGSTPTASAPIIYLNQNTLATWHTNAGSGGGFTEVGALTAGSAVRNAKSNDFTNNNTVVTSTHTPTNTHATWNPLHVFDSAVTYSNGNRRALADTYGGTIAAYSTLSIPNGASMKVYFELSIDTLWDTNGRLKIGCAKLAQTNTSATTTGYVSYRDDGDMIDEGSTSTSWGATFQNTGTDYVGVAIETDGSNVDVWFAKNNSWQASGDPGAGTSPAATMTQDDNIVIFGNFDENGSSTSGTLAVEADDWQGTAPTDFVALNTTNIAAATTRTGADYTDAFTQVIDTEANIVATLEAAHSYTNYLQIYKNRDSAESWYGQFSHDSGNAHTWSTTNTKTTFPSLSGSDNFVGYAFNGDATGISIGTVTHTNGGGDTTVTHNAGDADCAIYMFSRTASSEIAQYHPAYTPGELAEITGTGAAGVNAIIQNVSANAFDIDDATVTATYDYLVLSKACPYVGITEHVGNASAADGTFIPVVNGEGISLLPKWYHTLRYSAGGSRYLYDDLRGGYNINNDYLVLNTNAVESDVSEIDFVLGGGKLRTTGSLNSAGSWSDVVMGIPAIDSNGRILAAR